MVFPIVASAEAYVNVIKTRHAAEVAALKAEVASLKAELDRLKSTIKEYKALVDTKTHEIVQLRIAHADLLYLLKRSERNYKCQQNQKCALSARCSSKHGCMETCDVVSAGCNHLNQEAQDTGQATQCGHGTPPRVVVGAKP
jgi:hypothetical protein